MSECEREGEGGGREGGGKGGEGGGEGGRGGGGSVCVLTAVVVYCRGVPCLCLCQWRSLILVGGFSNGLIRLYSIETGHKTVEIAAHGRSVSALDIAQDSGLVSTV